jgi:hypothetical protein
LLFILFLCLAETNQTVIFNFVEIKTKLVPGFNIDHVVGALAMIFWPVITVRTPIIAVQKQ